MDSNIAKSLIGLYNCIWLSQTLCIPRGEINEGIDLIDSKNSKLGVELKSKDRHYRPRNFAVKNPQVREYPRKNQGSTLYWAFMLYSTEKRPAEVKPRDNLDEMLFDRETWFLPWEWIRKYPIRRGEGEDYRYPPLRDFPKNGYFRTQEVEGGVLHVPKGTQIDKRAKEIMDESKRRQLRELMDVPF